MVYPLCNFLHLPATFAVLDPNILKHPKFVEHQVSHAYKTARNIIVLYILTFTTYEQQKGSQKCLKYVVENIARI